MSEHRHWYVYRHREGDSGDVFYERTCGTEQAAKERVETLKEHGFNAWYQTEHYPGAFY